jgi:hypothetical protein
MSTFWTPEDFEWRRSRVVRDLYGASAPGDLPGVDDDEVEAGADDEDEFDEDEDEDDEEREDAEDEGAEEAP